MNYWYFCTMETRKTVKIRSVDDYCASLGVRAHHPHIALINYSTLESMQQAVKEYHIYGVFLKDDNYGTLRRRHKTLSYKRGSMIFVSPGQTAGPEEGQLVESPRGYALVFDRALLKGQSLEKSILTFPFFSYDVEDALPLSEAERAVVLSVFDGIREEISANPDSQSAVILCDYIEILLNLCKRIHLREFPDKQENARSLTVRFKLLIGDYFDSQLLKEKGLPAVAWCASHLNVTPAYLSDAIKRDTGRTPQELIHAYLVEVASAHLRDTEQSVSEIAYELGFTYPNHFTRLFRKVSGKTPLEYRREK